MRLVLRGKPLQEASEESGKLKIGGRVMYSLEKETPMRRMFFSHKMGAVFRIRFAASVYCDAERYV